MSVTLTAKNDTHQVAEHLLAAARELVLTTAYRVQAEWMTRAPVKTGAYRRSIGTEHPGPFSARVFSPLEYPIYLEYGTRFMDPRPSMNPAMEAVRPQWERGCRELFGG